MKTNMSDTSLLAYFRDVIPRLPDCQKKVLEVIIKYDGITNREISVVLGVVPSDICGRTNELVKRGLVIDGGKRPCKITSKEAHIWKFNKDYNLQHSHLKESVKEMIIRQRIQPLLV